MRAPALTRSKHVNGPTPSLSGSTITPTTSGIGRGHVSPRHSGSGAVGADLGVVVGVEVAVVAGGVDDGVIGSLDHHVMRRF